MLNHIPEEGEYVYNRYLIFISLGWITLLFAVILLVNQLLVKKEQKEIAFISLPICYYLRLHYTHI